MEEIVHFGPEGRLVGLLTGSPRSSAAPTLLLPNAGLLPRSGPFRLHVELARLLASRGNPVFRFDLPGVGEAPRLSACSDQDAVLAALDCLAENHGGQSFVVGGLCSAADLGWRVAARDPRVSGVLLLDGVSYAGPWFWLGRLKLALRRGPGQWPGIMRRRWNRLRGKEARVSSSDFRDWPTRAQARLQLRQMLARDVRLLFIYTGGADEHFLHRRQFAWSFGKPSRNGNVSLRFWPACDHMFYRRADRDRLLDTVAHWMQAQ